MVVRELVARLGLDIDEKAFALGDAAVNGLRSGFLKVGAVLGAVAVGLTTAAAQTAKAAGVIDDLRKQTGQSAQSLQELRYVADQTGVSFDGMINGMRHMSRAAVEASQGSKEAARGFANLGLDPTAFRTSDELLGAVADRIKVLKDSGRDMEATAAAMEIFGRSGAAMIPMLSEGSAGLQKMRDRAHLLGAVMDDELITAGDDFGDTLVDLNYALQGIRNMIAGPLLVPLRAVINAWAEWIGHNRTWLNQRIGGVVGSLGTALGVVWKALEPVVTGFLWLASSAWVVNGALAVMGFLLASKLVLGLRAAWASTLVLATSLQGLTWGLAAFWAWVRAGTLALLQKAAAVIWTGWTFKGLGLSIIGASKALLFWIATSARAVAASLLRGLLAVAAGFASISLASITAGLSAAWAAVAAAAAWVAALWPLWLVIAVIGILIAIIEDIWTAFQGGPSVFGWVFDQLKEKGLEALTWLTDKFTAFWGWIGEKWEGFKDFFSFGGDSGAGDFGERFGGGAGPMASVSRSAALGQPGLAQTEFKSNVTINPPPGTSAADIAQEVVSHQEDWSTRMTEAMAGA